MLPGLPLYIEESFGIRDPGQIRLWTSLVFGAGPFFAAIMGPFWGSLGDRMGRRSMVLRSVLAIAIVNAAMPIATSPFWLMALRALQGVFAGYVAPGIALVSVSAPPGRQGRVIAWLQVALATGMLFGPVIAAEIAEVYGRRAVFWFCAGMSGVAALPVLLIATEAKKSSGARPGVFQGFQNDLRSLGAHRLFLALLGMLLVMRLGQNMIEPLITLFVRELGPLPWVALRSRDHDHAIDRTTALCYTILAVAQIAFTPIWGRLSDRFGPLRCLAIASLGLGGILLWSARVATIEGYLVLRGGAALFMAGVMTLAYAAASKRIPAERRSLAFALVQSCIQLGLSLGPLLGQALVPIDATVVNDSGVRGLFVVAACCLLAAGIGMILLRFVPAREPVAAELMPEERT